MPGPTYMELLEKVIHLQVENDKLKRENEMLHIALNSADPRALELILITIRNNTGTHVIAF